jgi:hypothetical protein
MDDGVGTVQTQGEVLEKVLRLGVWFSGPALLNLPDAALPGTRPHRAVHREILIGDGFIIGQRCRKNTNRITSAFGCKINRAAARRLEIQHHGAA